VEIAPEAEIEVSQAIVAIGDRELVGDEENGYSVEKRTTGACIAGGIWYETLQAAINAAADDDKVILLGNMTGNGIIIDKSITIDMNDKDYVIDGTLVGSTGTQSCGFQILQGNTVTITNGMIVIDEGAVRGHDGKVGNNFAIQNYADLTLDSVGVVGNPHTSYVVSINSGNVALTGTTVITSVKDEGGIAFDVCKYKNYDAPTVTVGEKVTVLNGDFVCLKEIL
jgi:hypothetical protein